MNFLAEQEVEKNGKKYTLLSDEQGLFYVSRDEMVRIISNLTEVLWNFTDEEIDQLSKISLAHYSPGMYRQIYDAPPNGCSWENLYDATRKNIDHKKPKRKQIDGYVYFLLGGGYVKIGKSINIENRKLYFDIALPYEVSVFHSVFSNDYSRCERFFHEKYKKFRANGEWFKLPDDELLNIKQTGKMEFNAKDGAQ